MFPKTIESWHKVYNLPDNAFPSIEQNVNIENHKIKRTVTYVSSGGLLIVS